MAKKRSAESGAQFVRFMQPVIDALNGLGGSGSPDEVIERVAKNLEISDELQNEVLPSGGRTRFGNQVAWARFYLVKEGLIDSSKRGIWRLTPAGQVARLSPEQSRDVFLKWVRIFQDERRLRGGAEETRAENEDTTAPPLEEENIDANVSYRTELLNLLLALPAPGFERLSQRMLREAGFTQVEVTGGSNDGGIDGYGTLQINPLVSFKVLFQCKRYRNTVSPSQIRDFRGAMAGRADKGIIITTGSFSSEARREAARDGVPPIELIDAEKLLDLLERLELGLRPARTFTIDHAFLSEFK